MIKYFDLHSHLHDKAFDVDRQEIIKEMEQEGIGSILIGTDWSESNNALDLSKTSDNLYASMGQHPADNTREIFIVERYKNLYKNNKDKIVAIGECGLDYFHIDRLFENSNKISSSLGDDFTQASSETFLEFSQKDKERQKNIFREQILLASELHLPLMLHIRDVKDRYEAYFDAFEMIDSFQKENNTKIKCNLHFFTGSLEVAKKFLEIDATFSLPGVITFAREYDEVIRYIPIENLHAETDSPYATPIPNRGKRNSPLNIKYIVAKIAEIKELDEELVRQKLLENARRVFDIDI